MFGGGDASGGFSSGPGSDRMATCRVCSQKFASFPELKQHIREENHHDINMTKPITTNTTLNPSASSFVPGNITNNNNLSMNPFSSNMPRKASFDKSLTDSSISYNNKSPEMNPFSSGFSSMAPRDKNIVNTQLLSWASAGSTSQDFSMKVNPFAPQNSSTINNNNNNNNPFVKSILKTGYDDQKGENRHVNFKLNSTPDKFTSNNMTMNPSANPSFNPFANLNPNPIVSPAVPSSDASWKRQGTPAHGAIMKPQVQSMQMGHNDGNPFDTTAPAVNHAPRVKLKGKIKTNTTTVPAANTTTNNISAEAPPGLSSGKKLSRKDANASGGSEKWICRHCDIQCATSDEFEAHSRSTEHEKIVRLKLRALKKLAKSAGATPAKPHGNSLTSIPEGSATEDDDDADGGGGDYSDWDDSNSGSVPFPTTSVGKSAVKSKRPIADDSDGDGGSAPVSGMKSSIASRLGLPVSSEPSSKRLSLSSVGNDFPATMSQQSPFQQLMESAGSTPGSTSASSGYTPALTKQLFEKTPFFTASENADSNGSMDFSFSPLQTGFTPSSSMTSTNLNSGVDFTETDVSPLCKSRLSSSFTPAVRAESRPSGVFSPPTVMNSEDALDSAGAGICIEMCPEEERVKRDREIDVHVFEKPENLPWGNSLTLKDTMIKKFQRSSADHELQIPHLVRTPETLLRTIDYIETYIMDQLEEEPWSLSRYLFIWDRYRMIAKDFILQTSTLEKTGLWIECHERMARWYVLMDHRMKACEEYQGGHAQQNLESLNNLLKTLDGYYNNPLFVGSASAPLLLRNQGEFYSYFVLVQLGNTDFITKFLQSIPTAALATDEMKLALKVAGVLKRGEYAQFFRLLQEATPLQSSLMHKYVADMRFDALTTLARGLVKQTYYPVSHLIDLLMLEGDEEAFELLDHCGLEVTEGEGDEGPCAVLEQQSVLRLLPVDKNGTPIKPRAWYMGYWIDARLEETPTSDACKGEEDRRVSVSELRKPLSLSDSSFTVSHVKMSATAKQSPSILVTDTNKKTAKRSNPEAIDFSVPSSTTSISASKLIPTPTKPTISLPGFQLNLPNSGASSAAFAWPSTATTAAAAAATTIESEKKTKRVDESFADAVVPSKTRPPLNLPPKSVFPFQSMPPLAPSQSLTQVAKPSADGVAGEKLKEQAEAEAKALAEAKAAEIKLAEEKAARERAMREKVEEEARIVREKELKEKELLRKLEIEKQRQREAEAARVREVAAERERQRLLEIERERERERQRILEEQRKEQEREDALVPTQDSLHHVAKLKVARAVFGNWKRAFQLSQQKSQHKLTKLFFMCWKRAVQKQVTRRQKLLDTLHKVRIKNSNRNIVASEANVLKSKLKLLRKSRNTHMESSFQLDFDDVIYRNITAPSQIFPLSVVRKTLSTEFDTLATRFSPLATTGPSLLSIQSKKLRQVPGLSLPPRSFLDASLGAIDTAWQGSVFYKVALLSMCEQTGSWKDGDSFLWNLIRTVLSNINQTDSIVLETFHDSPLITGLWSGDFCDPQTEEKVGTGSVSVIDICTDSSIQSDKLTSAIRGVSTAFVLLPADLLSLASEPRSLPRLEALLDSLRTFIDRGTVLTLLITEEIICTIDSTDSSTNNDTISFTAVDIDELFMSSDSPIIGANTSAKVLECIQVIQRLLNNDSFLPLLQNAFLVQMKTPAVETCGSQRALFNVTPSALSHHALLAYECAQQALMRSAREAKAFPLLRKMDLFSWIETRLLSAVWSADTVHTEDQSLSKLIIIVNNILDQCKQFLYDNHAKLQDLYSGSGNGFPVPEFCILGNRTITRLSGCLYVAETGGDSSIAVDWCSDNRLLSAIQLLEKFTLPNLTNDSIDMDTYLSELRVNLDWDIHLSMPQLTKGSTSRRLVAELLRSRRIQLEDTLDQSCGMIYAPLSSHSTGFDSSVSSFRLPFVRAENNALSMQIVQSFISDPLIASSVEKEAFNMVPEFPYALTNIITDSNLLTVADSVNSLPLVPVSNQKEAQSSSSSFTVGEHLTALLQVDPEMKHTAHVTNICEQVSNERDAQKRLESLLTSALLEVDLTTISSNSGSVSISEKPNKENFNDLFGNSKRSKRGPDDLYQSATRNPDNKGRIDGLNISADATDVCRVPQSSNLKDVHEYLKRCRHDRLEFETTIQASTD